MTTEQTPWQADEEVRAAFAPHLNAQAADWVTNPVVSVDHRTNPVEAYQYGGAHVVDLVLSERFTALVAQHLGVPRTGQDYGVAEAIRYAMVEVTAR